MASLRVRSVSGGLANPPELLFLASASLSSLTRTSNQKASSIPVDVMEAVTINSVSVQLRDGNMTSESVKSARLVGFDIGFFGAAFEISFIE